MFAKRPDHTDCIWIVKGRQLITVLDPADHIVIGGHSMLEVISAMDDTHRSQIWPPVIQLGNRVQRSLCRSLKITRGYLFFDEFSVAFQNFEGALATTNVFDGASQNPSTLAGPYLSKRRFDKIELERVAARIKAEDCRHGDPLAIWMPDPANVEDTQKRQI